MKTSLQFTTLSIPVRLQGYMPYKKVGKICVSIFLATLFTILFSPFDGLTEKSVVQASPPYNILVIMVDDLDQNSFNQLLTANKLPNIQAYLIEHGMRFTDTFVTNSACCPSRATFLTGRYPHNHNVKSVGGSEGGYPAFHNPIYGGNPTTPTLAIWLNNNYYTGYVGKYMNSYIPSDPIPAGWDFWRGMALNKANDYPYAMKQGQYTLVKRDKPSDPGTPITPTVYQTKQIGDIGKNFISNPNISWAWAHPNHSGQPFFLVLAPTAPHVVNEDLGGIPGNESNVHNQFRQRVLADRSGFMGYPESTYTDALKYKCPSFPAGCLRTNGPDGDSPKSGFGLPSDGGPGFNIKNPDSCSKKPSWICQKWPDISGENYSKLNRQHLDRLESMLSVDVMIGQVLDALDDVGQLDNTLIIFTSDNGFMLGEHRLGNKQSPYEEAIRVPLVIRKPNAPAIQKVNQNLVANIDWAPTILDYVGLDWDSPTYKVDGRSLKPLLDEVSEPYWREWLLIEHWEISTGSDWWTIPDYVGVRTADVEDKGKKWRNSLYVEYNNFIEHYDMEVDQFQISNKYDNSNNQSLSGYAVSREFLKWMLYGLKDCSGAACRKRDTLYDEKFYYDGTNNFLTSVSRYISSNGPCYLKTGSNCKFDSRTLYYDQNGDLIESINAYNKHYNYKNGAFWFNGNLFDVDRYKSANGGPCSSSSCEFDSRSVYYDQNGDLIESINAYNKHYNYKNGAFWFNGNLFDVDRYKSANGGPCSSSSCEFDSRSHVEISGDMVESITAYGKVYNFANNAVWGDINGKNLHNIPKYALGPCRDVPPNQLCTFDSRAHAEIGGQTIESIAAYGRYFDFSDNYPW